MFSIIYLFLTISYFVFTYFWTRSDAFNLLIKIGLGICCLVGIIRCYVLFFAIDIIFPKSIDLKYFIFTLIWNVLMLIGFLGSENVSNDKKFQIAIMVCLNIMAGLIGVIFYV